MRNKEREAGSDCSQKEGRIITKIQRNWMEIIHTLKFTCEIPFLRMLRLLNIQMVQNLRKVMG